MSKCASDRTDMSIRSTYSAEETHGPIRNAVIQGRHYWINHPRLFRGQYARVTLARVVLRSIKELPANIRSRVPSNDSTEAAYYKCAQRVMTEVGSYSWTCRSTP